MTPMSRRVMVLVRFLEMLGVLMRFDFSVLMQGCRVACQCATAVFSLTAKCELRVGVSVCGAHKVLV